jgi:hypothetical protein
MGGLLSVAGSVPGSEELMYPIHVAAARGDSGWVRKKTWETCRDLGFHGKSIVFKWKIHGISWENHGKFMGNHGKFMGFHREINGKLMGN